MGTYQPKSGDRVRLPGGQQFRLIGDAGDGFWWARPWMKPRIPNLPPLPAAVMTLVHRVSFDREKV